jgi:hypothetical protein
VHPFLQVEIFGFPLVDPDTWANEYGDVVQAFHFDLVPNLPASLDDVAKLRWLTAENISGQGGGLIEADVVSLGGVPALRQIAKIPIPNRPSGLAFLGAFTVPKAQCSAVLKVQTVEHGTTGMREAMVMMKVGPQNFVRPHPFNPGLQGGLPFNMADDPAYDAQFPDHPLSRMRRIMGQLGAQVGLDPGYAALPPFTI